MQVTNVKVYEIAESIVASGYPMRTDFNQANIENEEIYVRNFVKCLLNGKTIEQAIEAAETYLEGEALETLKKHVKRAFKLAQSPANGGHCNFLKGILVSYDVTAPRYWWNEFQRYTAHSTIISSSSQVHKLTAMKLDENKSINEDIVAYANDLIDEYKKGIIDWDKLVSNMPQGIPLTARISTNYLQLRTMYAQRKNHKSKEWRDFCEWIETLPLAKEFITNV